MSGPLMQLFRRFSGPVQPRTNLIEITTTEECRKLFSQEFAVIFKHSEVCELSCSAYRTVLEFCEERPEVSIYLISVLDCRALALLVEEQTGVRHHSPQVLGLQNGTTVAHASHRKITFAFLEKFHGF
jgi:bacillithiol system protein YtxJ